MPLHPLLTIRPAIIAVAMIGMSIAVAPLMAQPRAPIDPPRAFQRPITTLEGTVREFDDRRNLPPLRAIFGDDRVADDAGWTRLTDADRARVMASQADAGRGLDAPPFPVAGLAPLERRLAEIVWPDAGDVALTLQVNRVGKVERVSLAPAVFEPLAQDVEDRLLTAGFRAARCNGRPCAAALTLTLTRSAEP